MCAQRLNDSDALSSSEIYLSISGQALEQHIDSGTWSYICYATIQMKREFFPLLFCCLLFNYFLVVFFFIIPVSKNRSKSTQFEIHEYQFFFYSRQILSIETGCLLCSHIPFHCHEFVHIFCFNVFVCLVREYVYRFFLSAVFFYFAILSLCSNVLRLRFRCQSSITVFINIVLFFSACIRMKAQPNNTKTEPIRTEKEMVQVRKKTHTRNQTQTKRLLPFDWKYDFCRKHDAITVQATRLSFFFFLRASCHSTLFDIYLFGSLVWYFLSLIYIFFISFTSTHIWQFLLFPLFSLSLLLGCQFLARTQKTMNTKSEKVGTAKR